MAVFTPVSLQDLTPWISSFSLGSVSNIRGISSGIENSNFFVSTEKGEYVLTLFEKLTFDELPFYLNLMQHLARKGIKVPAPVPDKNGRILHSLHGKPACLVTKLVGDWQPEPEALHCAQVGDMMAKMHLAGQDYSLQQPNPRGLEWWKKTVPLILSYLPVKTSFMLQDELRFQEEFASTNLYWKLYRGPIHADLFRNNVMFDSTRLTGFFDFYFAGCDSCRTSGFSSSRWHRRRRGCHSCAFSSECRETFRRASPTRCLYAGIGRKPYPARREPLASASSRMCRKYPLRRNRNCVRNPLGHPG